MQNGNGNGNRMLHKSVLENVGLYLLEHGNSSAYVNQCFYRGCETYWFAGGEYNTKEEFHARIAKGELPPNSFDILKFAIYVLNQVESVTPDELQSVKGLEDITHGPCRLCLRERELERFVRHQTNNHYRICYGSKQVGEICDNENHYNPIWSCSHPCTIHPEREALRRRRMELLKYCIPEGITIN